MRLNKGLWVAQGLLAALFLFAGVSKLVLPIVAINPNAATMTAGPITMTLTYSLKRRPILRGCSTRHTKLKLSSTFCTVEIKV